jgi:CubicO group peptidase (beta-lactamase class C family)
LALSALDDAFVALCDGALGRGGVPGAAVGLLADGETWSRGFGVDASGGAPVTPETTFRIASITKPFTATLALYLGLSQALDFAEEVPAPNPDVTVRHLLSHLGGFESECGDLARFGEGDDALTLLATELLRQRQVVPPGELWSYCNAGYWLLGWFLAERAGSTYEDALTDFVLRPLGLSRTGFGAPEATGYEGDEAVVDAYPRARRPSGGLVSNVADLLEFARLHLDEPETALLREPVAPTPRGYYGFGLALERAGGLELWGHTGTYGGFESRFVLEPERRFALVGLTNSGRGGLALDEIVDVALERVLGTRRPRRRTVRVAPGELELLAGRYAQPELVVALAAEGRGLRVEVDRVDFATGEVTREAPAHARPIGRRLFELEDGDRRGGRFDFHPDSGPPVFVRFASRLAERLEDER